MKDISEALYEIRRIDELGEMDTPIHRINAVIKIIVTFMYTINVVSIKSFDIVNIPIIIAYILMLIIVGKIPVKTLLKKTVYVLPIVICIGGINLIIDFSYMQIIKFFLLLFKSVFSVLGAVLLIATTGMNNLAEGLRRLKVPKILVSLILMLYRHIELIMEEAYRIKSAYELRTLDKKSMALKDWGGIMGQMLLRTIDRAEKVYEAMKIRGFEGEYYTTKKMRFQSKDYLYLIIFVIGFLIKVDW